MPNPPRKQIAALGALLLLYPLLLSCAHTAADPKMEAVEQLFALTPAPLVEEADEIARALRENTGVCAYLVGLRTRKNLGKNWTPGNASWEKAAATAKAERAAALKERLENQKQPQGDRWLPPTRQQLMKFVYAQFSQAEIDKLLAASKSDAMFQSMLDPVLAQGIIRSVQVPSECVSSADQRARDELIAKAGARRRTLEAESRQLRWDSDVYARFIVLFQDKSSRHEAEWANLRTRFDARTEGIVAEYQALAQR